MIKENLSSFLDINGGAFILMAFLLLLINAKHPAVAIVNILLFLTGMVLIHFSRRIHEKS